MTGERLLGVVSCAGTRCAALRRLAGGDGTTPRALCEAVASRPDAALVSTGCLGACHLACLVAVGPAVFTEAGRLTWTEPPKAVVSAERDGRTAALARWISDGAPGEPPGTLRPPA